MNEYKVHLHPLSRLGIYGNIKADSYKLEDNHFNFYTEGNLSASVKQEEITGVIQKTD